MANDVMTKECPMTSGTNLLPERAAVSPITSPLHSLFIGHSSLAIAHFVARLFTPRS